MGRDPSARSSTLSTEMEIPNARFRGRSASCEDAGDEPLRARRAQSIRESPCHATPGQPECDPERNRGRGVGEVVNRVREESDAPRGDYDDHLHKRSHEKACERPLQRPQPALVRRNGWIDHSMRMAVAMRVMTVVLVSVAVRMGITVVVLVRLFHRAPP